MIQRTSFNLGRHAFTVLFGFVISAWAATAGPVTYTYTGTTFLYLENCPTCVGGQPVTTNDHLSAYFVLDDPLGANFQGLVTPTDWAMFDGVSLLSPANAILTPSGNSNFGTVYVATDGLRNIASWQMYAGLPANISNDVPACLAGTATCLAMLTAHYPDPHCCPTVDYSFYYPSGGATTSLTGTDGVPGAWACDPTSDCERPTPPQIPEIPPPQIVPEPASLVLFGTGVAVMGVWQRRRWPLWLHGRIRPRGPMVR